MKKILGLSIAAILVIAMVTVGTIAYFQDTETSTGNTITAGTLNLTADVTGGGSVAGTVTPGADGANEFITISNVKPGDSGTVTFTLTNIGTVDGYLALASTVTSITNGTNEPEDVAIANNSATDVNLDTLLGVTLTRNASYILGDATNAVPLSGLQAILNAETNKSLVASGTITYVLSWSLATDLKLAGTDGKFGTVDDVQIDDNIIQTDKSTIDITFNLTQNSV